MDQVVVEEVIVVELKLMRRLVKAHESQPVNYVVAIQKNACLILSFGERVVEVKQKSRTLKWAIDRILITSIL